MIRMGEFPSEVAYSQPGAIEVRLGRVTMLLIAACVVVYFTPLNNYFAGVQFLSSLVHANFVHLFYNMLSLFVFGNLIELRFGSRLTVINMFAAIAASDMAFRVLYPGVLVVGISGYVYALIAVASVLVPKSRVLLPIGAVAVPVPVRIAAPFIAAGEFILNFVAVDNVAHIAHFAGLLSGAAVGIAYLLRKRKVSEEFPISEDEDL